MRRFWLCTLFYDSLPEPQVWPLTGEPYPPVLDRDRPTAVIEVPVGYDDYYLAKESPTARESPVKFEMSRRPAYIIGQSRYADGQSYRVETGVGVPN